MSNNHWANIQEAGAVSGMSFMFNVYRILGRTPFKICLYPVILYFYLFRRNSRKASLEYLKNLSAAGYISNKYLPLLSYRHFLNFGESLLDKLAAWQGDIKLNDVSLYNYEALQNLVNQGVGAVIIGSHLGNLEICRALSQQRKNIKISVLMHTTHAEKFNRMLKKAGSKSQVNIIQVNEINPATAIILEQKVSSGEFIVIAGDRIPINGTKNTSLVQFLGKPCYLPQGPFLIAAILKCPTLTLFCLRKSNCSKPAFELHLNTFANRIVLPRSERAKTLQEYCQKYADILEYYCTKAPLQWYNFHDFWAAPILEKESSL